YSPDPPASDSTANQAEQSITSGSSTGIITGRVVNDEGQSLPYVEVYAISTGDTPFVRGRTNTDGQGRFKFTLIAGSYLFNAKVPGYVSSQLIASAGSERIFYHLGDSVTLQ